jgi:probable phosphomutase (TIGR03848 family)
MTRFLLIRHGETHQTGAVLSGRTPGIGLNERGQQQAAVLPERLQSLPLDLVCTSPLERTRQTAEPLARAYGLTPRLLPELMELDYGTWRGKRPADLAEDSYWHTYNRHRSVCRIPGGELLAEAQLRMLHAVETLQREMPNATVALVGHGDPTKALLAYLLGLPLDFVNRLTIAPASVSIATLGPGEPRVHCINAKGYLGEISGECTQNVCY